MLQWKWDEKIGTAIIRRDDKDFPVYLYKGNALIIGLFEWHNDELNTDRYNLYNFFADIEHAKRCFGLVEGYDNIYKDTDELKVLELWTDKVDWKYIKTITDLFLQGIPDIEITLKHSPEVINYPHINE